MARFRIGLVQTVIEETTVTVEADTQEAAEQKALALCVADDTPVEWNFLEDPDPAQIITVDKLT